MNHSYSTTYLENFIRLSTQTLHHLWFYNSHVNTISSSPFSFFCSTEESRTSAMQERGGEEFILVVPTMCHAIEFVWLQYSRLVVICNHSNWSVHIDAISWTHFLAAYTLCNLERWTHSNLIMYKLIREMSKNYYSRAVDDSTPTLMQFSPAIRHFI